MILIDANLLIYAYDSSSSFHGPARAWLEEVLSTPQPVCLPWASILAFLRITTDRRILGKPFSAAEAAGIVEEWLAVPVVRVPEPTSRHWEILEGLVTGDQATGPLVTDAHLAALAIEHGAELCTTDRDFTRCKGLRWRNPLAQPDVVHEPRASARPDR